VGAALAILACRDPLGPGEVAELTLIPGTAWIGAGATLEVQPTAIDIDGAPVNDPALTWSTSAPATATVSNGRVNGVAPGTATITATSGDISASPSWRRSSLIPPSPSNRRRRPT
jgi:hypothetical protein